MTAGAPSGDIRVPLEVRIGMGMPGFAFGALTAAVLFAGCLAFRFLMERLASDLGGPASHSFAIRAGFIASLSTGYTLAAWRWVPRANVRDLVVGGLLPPAAERMEEAHYVGGTALQVRRSRWAGLAGLVLFFLLVEVPTLLSGGRPLEAWINLHTFTYMLALGVTFFWVSGRLAYFSLANGSPASALGEIDLLDLRPVRALGRIGLRSALAWVIGLTLGSFVFVFRELQMLDSLIVFVPLLVVTLAITLASLLLPLRGVHRRLRDTKERELRAVEAAVRGDPRALEATRLAGRTDLRLADLLAYRELVEGIPNWPFDSAGLRRLLLYLLIPIGSWLGGAVVERMLSAFLD